MIVVFLIFGRIHAVNIGYCAGEASKAGSFSVGGNTEVSGAVYLTPSFLAPYDGCEINALRGALASKVNIDRLTLWLRESLDGVNLVETTVTSSTEPALAKGWIEAKLDNGFTIDASKGVYLGMTYHQKGESKAFSIIGNGFENSFFVCIGEGDWEDRHSDGILSIEAVVAGNPNPEYDLALLEAVLDYSSESDVNVITTRVANNGRNAISGFTLEYMHANNPEDAVMRYQECMIASGEKLDVVCNIPKVDDVFVNPLTVRIVSIDNGEDAYSGNNSMIARVPARKKVLVEEFTTENCSNCPSMAKTIHDICGEDAYEDCTVVVCHHAGFYTDWLTQPCDEEIAWLYGCSYAPAVMYDRTPLPRGQLADTPDNKTLRDNLDRQLAMTPCVGISLTNELDSSKGELVVNVSLKRELALDMTNPCLSVYLTEDNIQPRLQSGDKDRTFIHQHVIRAYNSTWGESIEWNGSDYHTVLRFDLDSEWKVDDMRIIAFVNNYDSENEANNRVDNVECCRISGSSSSVEGLDLEPGCNIVCYDISGNLTDADAKGFVIKVRRDSYGSISVSKVFNP